MPEETGGEKTLPASAGKRERAREEGNVARSQDLAAAWTLLVGLFSLWLLGGAMFDQLTDNVRHFFGEAHSIVLNPGTVQGISANVVLRMARTVLPLMLLMLSAGLLINIVQVGLMFSAKPLQPKPERLNPITGMKKFFSLRALAELVKSLLKLAIVGSVVWMALRDRSDDIIALTYLAPAELVPGIAAMVLRVWWRIVLAMIVLGILDYAFQKWQHERELMMTVQEAREETRQFEGDPRVKRRIREVQRRMATQRMMREVPEAEVVITNPTTYAIALRYEPEAMAAPVVVAKGARLLAERIRGIAVEHDVPIVEKPELARALYDNVDVGQAIPEDLFRAVAEILAFVYRIDRRAAKRQHREQAGTTPAPATT